MAGLIKWFLVLVVVLALCDAQQPEQRTQRRRPARDGRRQRRHRTDKARLIQHYLKKNGRLEGMIRLVDGLGDFEGIDNNDFFKNWIKYGTFL